METKARHALIGLFVLFILAAGFGFTYWLRNDAGFGERAEYRIRFQGSVGGLIPGAGVFFNGIRVGRVIGIGLNPANATEAVVTVSVLPETPIRADTQVSLTFSGLTGVASVALAAGPSGSMVPVRETVLVADPASSQDVIQAARQALQKLDGILTDNAAPLKNAIANVSTFSDALARNSGKIDSIADGLSKMVGGKSDETLPDNYSLSPPTDFPAIAHLPEGQIVIADPSAPLAYNTQRLLTRNGEAIRPAFEKSRWSDNLPILIQGTLVQAFQNAKFPRVGRPSDNLAAKAQVMISIRDFTVSTGDKPLASVEIDARIVTEGGDVVDQKSFRQTAPVAELADAAAAGALSQAFQKVAAELVVWTLDAT